MAAPKHGGSTLPASGEGMTVIGEGIRVHGRITGEEDLRIEGRVEGSISLTETVHVAESGVVVATIQARDVVVSGVVVGNVSATNAVHLNPGAKLVGDIDAPRLIISDGAAFRGNVAMSEASPSRAVAEGSASRPKPATAAATRPAVTVRPRPAAGRATVASRPAARAAAPRAERAEKAAERPAAPRVAAIRPPRPAGAPDDEVTVVVRHAALSEDEGSEDEGADGDTHASAKKASKKVPPRARVPKPGKRTVTRR
jgi:cytoskeletal protein CcmA (bactofilin family)